jgi:hypothetical protein
MKTPDVTPAQLAAVLTFIAGQAVAFGWLTAGRAQLVVSIGATVIAACWKIADAIIRNGRSKVAAVQEENAGLLEETTTVPSAANAAPTAPPAAT